MSDARHVIWWSAGAASTIAARIHLRDHPGAHLVYTDTRAEHPDNLRFRSDVERWLGVTVEVLASDEYLDPWNVW